MSIPSHNPAVILAAALGILVMFSAMFAVAFGIGLLAAMWSAWWLVPVWHLVLVPLGVPAITFWHLVALRTALGVLLPHFQPYEVKKEYRDESSTWTARITLWAIGPVWVYYLTHWLM